jgi:hypothetical protein
VLLEYYHKHSNNMVHKKWIVDIANVVEYIFMLHKVHISLCIQLINIYTI